MQDASVVATDGNLPQMSTTSVNNKNHLKDVTSSVVDTGGKHATGQNLHQSRLDDTGPVVHFDLRISPQIFEQI
jgi:hypothetical protein